MDRDPTDMARLRPVAEIVLRAYKLTLSPVFQTCGVQCRHAPTCSEYAAEAVSRHGLWAGGWMGLARFCRCRPGGSSGFDPVPRSLRDNAVALAPWRYGDWKGPVSCDERRAEASDSGGAD